MTLMNIPSTPVAIQMNDIEKVLRNLGIVDGDTTLKDLRDIKIDGEFVTVTYLKMVKGIKEALYIERRIPLLHQPPASANTVRGQHPRLVVVDEVADIQDKEAATDGQDTPTHV